MSNTIIYIYICIKRFASDCLARLGVIFLGFPFYPICRNHTYRLALQAGSTRTYIYNVCMICKSYIIYIKYMFNHAKILMVLLLHTIWNDPGLQDSDVIKTLQGQLDKALQMIVQLQKTNQLNGVSPAGGAKPGPPSSATSTPSTTHKGSAAKSSQKASPMPQAGIASKIDLLFGLEVWLFDPLLEWQV